MPNITRGNRLGGLMAYLVGPGRDNQHVDPHLVAGDPAIMAWYDTAVLSHEQALAIGRDLGGPRRAFHVDVPDGHVWHASWALAADEGRLPDEKWAAIAQDIAAGMGFSGADGKAPCRWVAVHHGPSKGGNDHIHFVTSLVREDGTKANVWRDRPRAQALARELEAKYGLVRLEARGAGRGDRGVSRPVLERAQAAGREPETVRLARTVRAAATAAGTEAEFVRRLRRAGLRVDARFAADRADVVSGYSVARPAPAGDGIFYGGGHLAKDLTLPRLREAAGWDRSVEAVGDAVSEWTAAKRGLAPVRPGPELVTPGPELWDAAAAEIGQLQAWLRSVPITDRATWARVAGETAGAFAAWSVAVEGDVPGPLAHAADSLARSAQIRAHEARGARRGPSARGAALLLASIAHGGQGTVAQAVLLRQLSNTARALHDWHGAAGEARRAEEIARMARGELVTIAASLPTPVLAPLERGGGEPTAVAPPARGSVLPADLDRARARSTPARDRGPER